MYLTIIKDLYQHMEWADASVWRHVLSSASARDDQQLKGLFHHLHLVQHAYLRAWRGEFRDADFPAFATAPALMAWGRTFYPSCADYLEGMTDDSLAQLFPLPWAGIVTKELGRPPEPSTLGELMLQVPLHSHYHRGQINSRLRATGGEPPKVDYVAWVWLGRPAAEWEEEQD